MGREYFVTVGDAADVLPEARRRVAAVATLERQALVAPGLAARKALEARIHEALEWFDGEAVVVRETSPAVLDFNVLAGGRLVQLCWREGEDTFEAWHEVNGGYLGRYPMWTLKGAKV